MIRTAAALTLLLVACTPENARPMEFPDGSDGYELTCASASECMKDAREACGGSFAVEQSHGSDELVTTTSGGATRLGDVTVGRSTSRTHSERVVRLLVRCRKR